jgi:hypothetical protein
VTADPAPAINVADSLGRWARETPFAVAIHEPRRVLDYRDLDAAAWRAAVRLASNGIRPGDRVGLSPAGITFSWPRHTWPAWARRQAGPWARKISATSGWK